MKKRLKSYNKKVIFRILKPKCELKYLDTYEYLMSNPANKAYLEEAIKDIEAGNSIIRDLIEI